ncbi:MAG: LptF/LptG family permease, partial [Burkholderiales bacterium]|nr:LptF/LptG family permease [Burkholderiales bacterium]
EDQGTRVSRRDFQQWQSVLEPSLLNVLLVKPEKMSAWSLYSYSQHLKENRQKALRYEIALWTKLLYPVAVVVMMILALPFAYFQNRQGGVGAKVFAGIMIGLGFHFLNRLFGHLGLLNDWPPFASAIAPTLMFMGLAMTMMWWQERR